MSFSIRFDWPPTGLEMRPVNVAYAPTCGQTGRKEAAEKLKEIFRGHPEPRQRTQSSALLFGLPPAAEKLKEIFRGPAIVSPRYAAPNPGKGLRPLHSCLICCLRWQKKFFERTPKPRQGTASSALLFNSLCVVTLVIYGLTLDKSLGRIVSIYCSMWATARCMCIGSL